MPLPVFRTLLSLALLVIGSIAMPATNARADADFDAWLSAFRADALAAGLKQATFDKALTGITPDPDVLKLLEDQPEHVRSAGDYVTRAVSENRIAQGRAKLAEFSSVLDAIETLHGVDRHVLVAIWGMESSYGNGMGDRLVVRSLATLAFAGERRADFGRKQLIAALQIIENGDITPEAMTGSWAGAMGHTQFIPTTYNAYAVDFDNDGRRDIWGTVPDALASTANYLKASGWQQAAPWGFEVSLPAKFDFGIAGRRERKPVSEWMQLGVTRADGGAFPDQAAEGAIILPAGAGGPAFLVMQNFRAILRYNQSTSYALAIGHLADRLRGGQPFRSIWPEGDKPLARLEREELQKILSEKGYDTGGIDGILGTKSREAVRAFQQSIGVPADGHPNSDLLQRLREASRS